MKKIFSIFCCLLLSAGMVTQAQLQLDNLENRSNEKVGVLEQENENLISGRKNAPQASDISFHCDYADVLQHQVADNGTFLWDDGSQFYNATTLMLAAKNSANEGMQLFFTREDDNYGVYDGGQCSNITGAYPDSYTLYLANSARICRYDVWERSTGSALVCYRQVDCGSGYSPRYPETPNYSYILYGGQKIKLRGNASTGGQVVVTENNVGGIFIETVNCQDYDRTRNIYFTFGNRSENTINLGTGSMTLNSSLTMTATSGNNSANIKINSASTGSFDQSSFDMGNTSFTYNGSAVTIGKISATVSQSGSTYTIVATIRDNQENVYFVTLSAVAGGTEYTISTAVSPSNTYGTVTGAGSYTENSVVTLTATSANEHLYIFDHWEKAGVNVGNTPTITPTVTAAATYTAVFRAAAAGTITGYANPLYGSATVSPSGNQAGGTAVTLTVTPNSGYMFVQWEDGNTDNPRTVYVDGNKTYTAQFLDLSVPVLGAYSYENSKHHIEWGKWGYSDPHNTYVAFWDDFNTPQHSEFLRLQIWDETVLDGNNNATTYNNLQLCFWVSDFSNTYAGTMAPQEGVYTVTEPEIRYDAATAVSYGYEGNNLWGYDESSETYLDKVIIGCDPNKAIADSYWRTDLGKLWTTTQSPYVAYFSKKNLSYGSPYDFYTITNGTTVKVERGKDDKAYVVATLPNGRVLFTVGEPAPAVTTHTVTISTPANGTITVKDGETTINSGDKVIEGTTLTVTTTPATGYHFDSWTNDGAASVTVNSDVTIGATFAINTYTVTVAKSNNGYGTLTDESDNVRVINNVPYGTVITTGTGENANKVTINGTTVTATPAANDAQYSYAFSGWTNGAATVTGNMTVTANFTRTVNTYDITFKDADGTTLKKSDGTTDAVYSVAYGATPAYDGATPSKVADSEYTYTFNGWDNEIVAVTTAAIYTATYSTTKVQYTLTWDVNGGNELTGTYTNGTIDWGTAITKPADPTKSGYTFNGWDADNDGTADEVAETMPTTSLTYKAIWVAELPNITLCENCENDHYDDFKSDYDGETVNVTYPRQFAANRWSTMCLPFSIELPEMIVQKMYGRVYEFKYATGNANTNSGVNLYFSNAKKIEAGKCYIVNANDALAAKTSFVFSGVTIDLSKDNGADLSSPETPEASMAAYNALPGDKSEGTIELVGTLRNGILMGTATGNKYMGLKENKIYYPNTGTGSTIWAYRGIFRSTSALNVEKMRIVVDGEDRGEIRIDNGELIIDNGSPVRKFIRNGNLYIEREGVIYDAQGKRVE